jgi:hypothetical protein
VQVTVLTQAHWPTQTLLELNLPSVSGSCMDPCYCCAAEASSCCKPRRVHSCTLLGAVCCGRDVLHGSELLSGVSSSWVFSTAAAGSVPAADAGVAAERGRVFAILAYRTQHMC